MRKDSTIDAAEIYIKRTRIDSDIESIYSQRQYRNKDAIDYVRYTDMDMRIIRAIFLENSHIKLKKVIFNDPATIVFWEDGTKTVVKCDSEDEFDKEKGILYAALKKLSTREVYNDILRATDSIQDPFVEGVAFCTEAKDE